MRLFLSRFSLLVFGMVLAAGAFAGSPLHILVEETNDPSTRLDDLYKFTTMGWPDSTDEMMFLYNRNGTANTILLPTLNGDTIENWQVVEAINEALKTWNGAEYGSRKFMESAIPSDMIEYTLNPSGGYPNRVSIDGFNVITFTDDEAFEADLMVATAVFTYFTRDFDYSELPFDGVDLINLEAWNVGGGAAPATTIIADFDFDGNVDLAIPYEPYKAGDLIDFDITFDPGMTDFFNVWPQNKGDIPSSKLANLPGSVDIQATLTTLLGIAQGIGFSYIQDSVMYPVLQNANANFPTDPYKKRELQFDDQMAAGIVNGGDFGSDKGMIAGQVLNGDVLQRIVTVADDGTLEIEEQDLTASQFMPMVPVYVGRRLQSDELAIPHPDNLESNPVEADENQGTYRLIAQVFTGEDLAVAAGSGIDFEFGITNPDDDTGDPPGQGEDDEGTDDEEDPYISYFQTIGYENGNYYFPGLDPYDKNGTPITYAVYLGSVDDQFPVSPGQALFAVFRDLVDYPEEFYGGPTVPIEYGSGGAVIEAISGDEYYENAFVTVQVNEAGRISAAINDGIAFLSGFMADPSSFIRISSDKGSYSNLYGSIGNVIEPVIIEDDVNRATALWRQVNDFDVAMDIQLTNAGGNSGLESGVEFSYRLTNNTDSASTYTFQQLVDSFLFGRENPIYYASGMQIDSGTTFLDDLVPSQIVYQSNAQNPTFSSYIELRGANLVPPTSVTIGELNKIFSLNAGGTTISGSASTMNLDTGVLLTWADIALEPGESKELKFIVGFNPPGEIKDTWVPYPEVEDEGEVPTLNGDEDDPEQVVAVTVEPGMVTSGIDIITNTGTSTESQASQTGLRLVLAENGFPDTDSISACGALGDIDNDGDLDCVVANFGYGSDTTSGQVNRIYLNEERINADGSLGRYFKDVTYGDDSTPDTPDDRLVPFRATLSRGVVLADFDGDGYLDIFFTNALSGNQFYLNAGEDNPGHFTDVSAEVLPGTLNAGYDPVLDWATDAVYAFRATAGDIDSDGDLDLIVSYELPFSDTYITFLDDFEVKTYGFIDSAPRDDVHPYGDGLMNMSTDLYGGPFYYCERVLINQINQPNYAAQNKADVLPVGTRGFYFIDETLGSDNRTGTLTSLTVTRPDSNAKFEVVDWDPSELDRMPPVLPVFHNINADHELQSTVTSPMGTMAVEPILGPFFADNSLDLISIRSLAQNFQNEFVVPDTAAPDPAIEGIDFVQTGDIWWFYTSVSGGYGTDQAFFRNMDLFSVEEDDDTFGTGDGLCDGYFACMNYNMDYGAVFPGLEMQHFVIDEETTPTTYEVPTGPGLFAYSISPESVVGETTPSLGFVYDAYPLFIGLPDGHAADFTPDGDGFELNLFPEAMSRPAWAGVIGDWEGRTSAMPFIAGDNDAGSMYSLTFEDGGGHTTFIEAGVQRGLYGLFTGYSKSYRAPYTNPYIGYTDNIGGDYLIENPVSRADDTVVYRTDRVIQDYDANRAEPYGACTADFDLDGDPDIVIATSTYQGISDSVDGMIYLGGTPAPNELLINSSLGGFIDGSELIVPNDPAISMYCMAGDVDNDGDTDLVVLNAASPNELYINKLITAAPDLSNKYDTPLFVDKTLATIPQTMGGASAPPFIFSQSYTGVTLTAAIGDFDMNSLPDIVLSEGGRNTMMGDISKLLLNGGLPSVPGAQVYHPAGAPYPGPRLNSSGYVYEFVYGPQMIGTLGYRGYGMDAAVGDLDADGDPDIVLIQNLANPQDEGGDYILTPQILMNIDSDDPLINSVPDPDSLGDAIFEPRPDLLGPIEDPDESGSSLILKKQGRKVKLADVTGNGYLDIIVANGRIDGGAPNLLMFNDGDDPGSFTDMTEKKLPSEVISDIKWGIMDNTEDLAVADFDSDGDLDIVFANDASGGTSIGFRYLTNDGTGRFIESDPGSKIPTFEDPLLKARGLGVGDVDKLGEKTEDINYNGVLDPGEDTNDNGQLDWEDLPTETEDLNGNGVLDAGEDGLIDKNGKIDQVDINNDGLITARRDGVWDGSLDLFVTFDDELDQILINYFNTWPLTSPVDQAKTLRFVNETSFRFPGQWVVSASRAATMGDIDLDGDLDIVVAQHIGGAYRYVNVWRNGTYRNDDGYTRYGAFTDISYEVANFHAMAEPDEVVGVDDELVWIELEGQPSAASFGGFANDVKLFDYDLDGDLDMFISCMGTALYQAAIGSPNVFYENRLIGDGFNKKIVGLNRQPGSPIVYDLSPNGGKRGQVKTIVLSGDNFSSTVRLSFGEDITVLETQMISENKLSVTISIDDDASLGNRRITIYDPDTGKLTKTKDGAFIVFEGLPGSPVPNRLWELYD